MLDRRVADRRRGADQRLPDRRRKDRRAPAMEILAKLWLQGYAVVHVQDRASEQTMSQITSSRGYRVEAQSERLPTGEWAPKAVVTTQSGGIVRITPLDRRKPVSFPTQDAADRYAIELAAKYLGE